MPNSRKPSVDREVELHGPAKTDRVNLGLAILSSIRRPGVAYSYTDIACFAGCTDSNIKLIEQKALKKLRIHAKQLIN